MTAPEYAGKNGRNCGLTRPQGEGVQQHNHEPGSQGHSHEGHGHSHAPKSLRSLVAVIALTSVIFFAELIGGLVSGSMALLADAMHMLSDSTGLIIALVAMLIGRKSASSTATYGYRRAEVLAAMLNAGVVTVISVWVVVQAVLRLRGSVEINTDLMLLVAVIGFLANGISALVLMRHQNDSMNMRGAFLHVLSDMLASVAVIIAGLVIRYTGWMFADTIASLAIAAIILPRSLGLLRDAAEVLLERVPRGVDTQQLEDSLLEISCVAEVHDLHVWSLDGRDMLATVHLVVDQEASQPSSCTVLDLADEVFAGFGIGHSTIQLESPGHQPHEGGLAHHH